MQRLATLERAVSTGEQDPIISGQQIGSTIVLTRNSGATINIPVNSGSVDFNNLSTQQKTALNEVLRGQQVNDAFNQPQGYLIEL